MKILFLINSFGTGGAETQVLSLCQHLVKSNDVCVVTLKSKPNDLVKSLKGLGVDYYSLEMDKKLSFLFSFSKLNSIVKKFRPDAIHAHLAISIIYSRLYKLIYRYETNLIGTAHSTNIGSKWMGYALKATDRLSSLNTNVSQAAVDAYTGKGYFSKNKTIHVPNGFKIPHVSSEQKNFFRGKVRERYGISRDDFLCVAISRLAPVKNHKMMIDAIAIIKNKYPKVKLLILGDGPERKNIENLILHNSLSDNVIVVGNVDDIYPYAFASDLYLMTSIYEGMPLSICEAMIAELPVISTYFNGVDELVRGHYPVVDQGDVKSLCGFIIDALEADYSLPIQVSKRNVLEEFEISRVSSRWISIYKEKFSER